MGPRPDGSDGTGKESGPLIIAGVYPPKSVFECHPRACSARPACPARHKVYPESPPRIQHSTIELDSRPLSLVNSTEKSINVEMSVEMKSLYPSSAS